MTRFLLLCACTALVGFAPAPMSKRADPERLLTRYEEDVREAAREAHRAALAARQRQLLANLAARETAFRERGRDADALAVRDRIRLLETVDGARPLGHISSGALLERASAGGRYSKLLRVLYVPQDEASCGEYQNFGAWNGASWGGENNLPPGHWVYVAPRWFIWAEVVVASK